MSKTVEDSAQKASSPSTAPPQNQGSLSSQNIIGSKISLVTNAQVRYEGVLCEVDPIKKSMTLMTVRSFGTEGRRGGVNEINPIDSEIPQVQFKVDQIKDFKIIGKPDQLLLDPAILSTSSEAGPISKTKKENVDQIQPQKQEEVNKKEIETNQEEEHQIKYSQKRGSGNSNSYRGGFGGERGGRGGGYYKSNQQRNVVGEIQENPNQMLKEKLKDQFDFEHHQLDSDKKKSQHYEETEAQNKNKEEDKQDKAKYDKSNDFFDSISNSTQITKSQSNQEGGEDFRKKDAETFGYSSNYQYNGRGNRGGRGRGGGRGYRGRGRGGYGRGGYDRETNEDGGGGYQQYQSYNQGGRGRGGYYKQKNYTYYNQSEDQQFYGNDNGKNSYYQKQGGGKYDKDGY